MTKEKSRFINHIIPLFPSICLLKIHLRSTGKYKTVLLTALTIDKKTILTDWKSKNNINITHYKNLIINYLTMEKVSASIKTKATKFDSIWTPLITYIHQGITSQSLAMQSLQTNHIIKAIPHISRTMLTNTCS